VLKINTEKEDLVLLPMGSTNGRQGEKYRHMEGSTLDLVIRKPSQRMCDFWDKAK
jgi:hypothetical protein